MNHPPRENPPLRIAFETGDDLLEHLRYNEGLASFRWNPSSELPPLAVPGTKLPLVLEFDDTKRRFHILARVLTRIAEGPDRGIRFEFMRDQPLRQEIVLMSARGESIPYRRRSRPRLECELDAKLAVAAGTVTAKLTDISATGAQIEIGDELELDSTVHVDVTILGERIRVAGRVSWTAPCEAGHSHGVEFVFESATHRDRVACLVARLAE